MSSNHITFWTTLFGSSLDNQSNDVVIGNDGSIYITGRTRGNLNSKSNSGLDDAFISKFNNEGEIQWTRLLGTSEDEESKSIAIGSDGSIYVAVANDDDVFISKFNRDGDKQWTKL